MSAEARSLEEIASEINSLLGATDDDPATQAWRMIRNSQRDCSCCGKCGKEIAAGERVCRTRISRAGGLGGTSHSLVALCQGCAERDWYWQYREMTLKPCEGCGREVWSENATACCEQCTHNLRLATARRRRAAARGTRECEVCKEAFEPTRTDSKFCSGACKQKAYRERVTDNAVVLQRYTKMRNAERAKPKTSNHQEIANGTNK